MNSLFDILDDNAFDKIKIQDNKSFLQHHREPGRLGFLAGVDKKIAEKKKKLRQRKLETTSSATNWFHGDHLLG